MPFLSRSREGRTERDIDCLPERERERLNDREARVTRIMICRATFPSYLPMDCNVTGVCTERWNTYFNPTSNKRRWCSGIMQDSHSCDPGSIPGRGGAFTVYITVVVAQPRGYNGS